MVGERSWQNPVLPWMAVALGEPGRVGPDGKIGPIPCCWLAAMKPRGAWGRKSEHLLKIARSMSWPSWPWAHQSFVGPPRRSPARARRCKWWSCPGRNERRPRPKCWGSR